MKTMPLSPTPSEIRLSCHLSPCVFDAFGGVFLSLLRYSFFLADFHFDTFPCSEDLALEIETAPLLGLVQIE